jgi:outer membrane lipopolysaccharide assembly protein LptE/RlpB
LINSKNKIIKTASANKTLKVGGIFTSKVNEAIPRNLVAGEYAIKIKIFNAKTNKLLAENSFKIQAEKLKKKYFSLVGEMPVDTDIAFDKTAWGKVKTNVLVPNSLKLKYSYTNNTDKKHTAKMVRELVDSNSKVLETKTGKWVMKVGEKDSTTFTQAISTKLIAGEYAIRIRAYDWTSKELLAENSFGFKVELK